MKKNLFESFHKFVEYEVVNSGTFYLNLYTLVFLHKVFVNQNPVEENL